MYYVSNINFKLNFISTVKIKKNIYIIVRDSSDNNNRIFKFHINKSFTLYCKKVR